MEFLTGHKLNAAIEDVIRNAEVELLIVSPYIKLHERNKEALKTLRDKPEIKVTLLYGKAHGDKTSTFHKDSITFFKSLPNIEIAHRKNLHAKFYANEKSSVMTSMNLYDYSQDINVETGYGIDASRSKGQANDAQTLAWNHFFEIFEGADAMFNKEAQFESRLLGLSKKYTGSEIKLDHLDETGNPSNGRPTTMKRKPRTRRELSVQPPLDAQTVKPKKKAGAKAKDGYCIATAKLIPLNVARPMAYPAYKAWMSDTSGDVKAPMKNCHFSGEATQGKTTVERPIARKHWKAAQEALTEKD